jgi:hypothetical protein
LDSESLQRDHELLERYLNEHTASDASLRPLEKRPDERYGTLYAFDVTPCCYPLHSLAWINPVTPGVFFRCYFEQIRDDEARRRVRESIEPINYGLPAGSFAVGPLGEVVFKNAVYYEGLPLSRELLEGLFLPSLEFISAHWEEVLTAVFGSTAAPHNH